MPRAKLAVNRPDQQRAEYLTSRALRIADVPGSEISSVVPQPRPLFPPRFGYDTEQPTINDVLATAARVPDYRTWISGGPASFSASSRPSGEGWI